MKNLPNQVSLLRILLTPVFIFLLLHENNTWRLISFLIFTIAVITDYYDGYAARKLGVVSDFGTFLDPLADKVLVLSAFICFSLLGYFPFWMVIIVVLRDVVITGFRMIAMMKGLVFTTEFFAKMKTFGQMVVLYIIYILYLINRMELSSDFWLFFNRLHDGRFIYFLMLLITMITVISGIQYFYLNRKLIIKLAGEIFQKNISS